MYRVLSRATLLDTTLGLCVHRIGKPVMPYLMHYVNSNEPQEITEEDTKRMINQDFKDETMRAEMMKRLVKGEKVFLKPGFVTWVGG